MSKNDCELMDKGYFCQECYDELKKLREFIKSFKNHDTKLESVWVFNPIDYGFTEFNRNNTFVHFIKKTSDASFVLVFHQKEKTWDLHEYYTNMNPLIITDLSKEIESKSKLEAWFKMRCII